MNKTVFLLLIFSLFSVFCFSQKKPETKALDSVQKDLDKQGIRIADDSAFVERKKINPLAPSKAAFYSAVLPGLGQIYNKRYWKVPLVYAAIGTGVFAYVSNDNNYTRVRDEFKARLAGLPGDEELSRFDQEDLQDFQERFQEDRDLALLITIGLYALNIIDANVDAHLKQFNVDDDLSVDFKPFLEYNPITASPNYGMGLTIKF